MDCDKKGIALGSTPEDLKNRKKFITDFYTNWIIANPTKHNLRLVSYVEAVKRYNIV